MAIPLGPGQPGLSDDQMMDKLRQCMDTLTNEFIQGDVDREKVVQLANVRRNHLYWEGKQFLYPVIIQGQVVDFSAVSGSILSSQAGGQDVSRAYDYVINHVRGDGRKFISVLGQRAPNVKAVADRPTDDRNVRMARRADDIAGLLESHWEVERIQRELALRLWKDGTTFLYTPYVANGDRYGFTEEPQLDLGEQPIGQPSRKCLSCGMETPMDSSDENNQSQSQLCPSCGGPTTMTEPPTAQVPQETGTTQYPNGSVELHIASVMEVTVPFYSKDLKDTPWLWYEFDEHKANLIRAYPKLRDMLKNDPATDKQLAASNMGRITRDIASGPNSLLFSRGNRWLYQRFWLRPAMYGMITDQQDQNGELKNLLKENYPTGIKATYVAGKLVQLEHESIDEVWTMVKPETSEYIYANPLCEDYLGPQDVINDSANIMIEWIERAIPLTVVDPQVFDIEALRKYSATPMEFIPAKASAGQDISKSMQTLQLAKPEPMMAKYAEQIREEARQIVGILPPIFGGDTGVQTAREAELKRNQAMMQLSVTWNEMRLGWAAAYENGVVQLAKHSGDRINMLMGNSKKPTQYEIADLAELANGGWHFEAQESMPMTWGQKRDTVWDMVDKGPAIWGLFGLQHPANLPVMQEVLGLPDFHTPGLNMRDYIMDKIQQLLQASPQMVPDPMSGIPKAMPSSPIDVSGITEDHHMVVQLVSDWAVGEDGQRAKMESEEGYQNVLAWARAHLEQLGPPPGAPGAPPAPTGPPKPGAPPSGPPKPPAPGGGPQPPPLARPVPSGNQVPMPPTAPSPGGPSPMQPKP